MVLKYGWTVVSAMLFDVCCASISRSFTAMTSFLYSEEMMYTSSGVDRREILESSSNSLNPVSELSVVRHSFLNFFEAVNHSRVITTAKTVSDLDELSGEELSGQIHGNLTRCGEKLRPGL